MGVDQGVKEEAIRAVCEPVSDDQIGILGETESDGVIIAVLDHGIEAPVFPRAYGTKNIWLFHRRMVPQM